MGAEAAARRSAFAARRSSLLPSLRFMPTQRPTETHPNLLFGGAFTDEARVTVHVAPRS